MDSSFKGERHIEYSNSWLFSPVAWDVLLDKYLHDEIQTPFGYTKSLIGPGADDLWKSINNIMNQSDNLSDRVCWELSQQQIFHTKDG